MAAETAHDLVSPSSGPNGTQDKHQTASRKADQPVDLREGVTNAYNVLSEVSFERMNFFVF